MQEFVTDLTRETFEMKKPNGDVPSKDYDRVHRLARRDGVSVPEVLRRGMARVLADPDDD